MLQQNNMLYAIARRGYVGFRVRFDAFADSLCVDVFVSFCARNGVCVHSAMIGLEHHETARRCSLI